MLTLQAEKPIFKCAQINKQEDFKNVYSSLFHKTRLIELEKNDGDLSHVEECEVNFQADLQLIDKR